MDNEVWVGVGEDLGRILSEDGSRAYGVQRASERYEVDDATYNVWRLMRSGKYTEEDISKKLGIGQRSMGIYLSCLTDVEMVIRWGDSLTKEACDTHRLVARGNGIEKDDGNYEVVDPVSQVAFLLPLIPATIWKLAKTHGKNTVTAVLERFAEVSGYSEEETRYEVIGWVPYLVGSGLLVIDGVPKQQKIEREPQTEDGAETDGGSVC